MDDKLNVLLYTDSILHRPTENVEDIDQELIDIVSKMLFCMREHTGVGLSANQVGINRRFCVVSLNNGTTQLAMINPVITARSPKKITLDEGCLSAPRIWLPTKRHKKVKVKFTSLAGIENEYEMTDIDARIIQHEIDHLDGVTIFDSLIGFK